MKKVFLTAAACGVLFAAGAKADEYQDCMSKAVSDMAIIECNDNETTRLVRNVQTRYSALSGNKYFSGWNDQTLSSAQNFQMLMKQWLDFRDKYCSLYGYTFSQGEGTLSRVQESQCLVDLTKRFAKDVESVIAVYNNIAVN